MKAVQCGLLVDGVRDHPKADQTLLIEDGKVVDTFNPGELDASNKDIEIIDHSDDIVIPGLIDAHCHVDGWRALDLYETLMDSVPLSTARAIEDLEKLIEAGFTSIRDVGSVNGLGLREAVAEGTVHGPRIYTSGRLITQTAGHGDYHSLPYDWVDGNENWFGIVADGEDEVRKETRKLLRQGVDLIKIMTSGGIVSEKDSPFDAQMTDAEIQAATQEAHRVDLPVASHAIGKEGIKNAVRNGVDTIEHGSEIDEETAELMDDHGTILVPTLAILKNYCEKADELDIPQSRVDNAQEIYDTHIESVKLAARHGIDIAVGTDFVGHEVGPHGENVLELEILVDEVGFDEMAAIKAATAVAAKTMNKTTVGTLESGSYADFITLERNPLDDISALREPKMVYKDGTPVAGTEMATESAPALHS